MTVHPDVGSGDAERATSSGVTQEEDGIEDITAGEQEEDQPPLSERDLWCQNAVVLYDLFVGYKLTWPALSVAWLPDEPHEGCRLAIGTHTDGSSHSEVIVAELNCNVQSRLDAQDLWRSWEADGVGAASGFGCLVEGAGGPLRPVARLQHPTEVNSIAPCPHLACLLATKTATGEVLLFDYKADRLPDKVCPDATLTTPGQTVDGFALGWSSVQEHRLASGGNDGRLSVWDTAAALQQAGTTAALQGFRAHKGPLCDLSFSRFEADVLATVGDDCMLNIWDLRAGHGSTAGLSPQLSSAVSKDEVLSVDWSFHAERTVATAGKDKDVRIWDLRSLRAPLREMSGHKNEIISVRWAPFREGLLATGSMDTRVHLWDLSLQSREPDDQCDDEASELLFAHSGHEGGLSSFAWSETDNFLMCSVAEDATMQVWQPATVFYLADSEGEAEEDEQSPPAKRRREEAVRLGDE